MPKTALHLFTSFLVVIVMSVGSAMAAATPTDVTVRVRAHDAKFIGSGVGGMHIRFEDAVTGELLDSGEMTGGTGDTKRLMKQPHRRGEALADEDTAHYTATLALEEPRRIRIRATGPTDVQAGIQDISVTTWVVPGQPIGGDGIVLQLPGLIVDAEASAIANGTLPLVANVTLMCGCPITDGGLWDSNDYIVRAHIEAPDGSSETQALSYAGEPNRFSGAYALTNEGRYKVTIWAHHPGTGNTGAAEFSVIHSP